MAKVNHSDYVDHLLRRLVLPSNVLVPDDYNNVLAGNHNTIIKHRPRLEWCGRVMDTLQFDRGIALQAVLMTDAKLAKCPVSWDVVKDFMQTTDDVWGAQNFEALRVQTCWRDHRARGLLVDVVAASGEDQLLQVG